MAEHESRKSILPRFLITVIILIVVILLFRVTVWKSMKQKAAGYVTQKAVETMLRSEGIPVENEEIKELYESMPAEEKELVEEIITDHMNAETVTEVTTYITNKDKESLKQYAKDNFSEEEIAELMSLYEKYKDQLDFDAIPSQ